MINHSSRKETEADTWFCQPLVPALTALLIGQNMGAGWQLPRLSVPAFCARQSHKKEDSAAHQLTSQLTHQTSLCLKYTNAYGSIGGFVG